MSLIQFTLERDSQPAQRLRHEIQNLYQQDILSQDLQLESLLGSLHDLQGRALSGDADAQNTLLNIFTRGFIKNNDVSAHIMDGGGRRFTFDAGTTYCCAGSEAIFFLAKAKEKGFDFSLTNMAEWLATGVVQEFFS